MTSVAMVSSASPLKEDIGISIKIAARLGLRIETQTGGSFSSEVSKIKTESEKEPRETPVHEIS